MPFVRSAGVPIYYEDVGRGACVLLHTGSGGDRKIWEEAGYLSGLSEFRVLAMDQRGRGRSGRPNSVAEHAMESYVTDVARVLDDAGVRRCAFWGYSAGLYVGIAFGARFPERLAALVGTGTLRYRDLRDLPRVDPEISIAEDVRRGGVLQDLEAHMTASGERFPEGIDRNVRAGDPRMYALDGVAWSEWAGPRSQLAHLVAPILLLGGEREDPGRATEETVAKVPGATLHRLPGVGHLGAFARSDLALPLVLPFLRRHLNDPKGSTSAL